ncbi:kinase-like domain-containing protein [Gamsiella multidivaricata]|uniref:kinase-like domain-containing protein n=1 Tax=Gamsiella multidivaricata TaxID=101098 RepID=UPI00221E9BBF|nr:kinase-like domain-containing protein [Gamsiella multidivaricata]KAI7817779.1 kinase-like domain-containing protein [Gamsiella multidivaricata]
MAPSLIPVPVSAHKRQQITRRAIAISPPPNKKTDHPVHPSSIQSVSSKHSSQWVLNRTSNRGSEQEVRKQEQTKGFIDCSGASTKARSMSEATPLSMSITEPASLTSGSTIIAVRGERLGRLRSESPPLALSLRTEQDINGRLERGHRQVDVVATAAVTAAAGRNIGNYYDVERQSREAHGQKKKVASLQTPVLGSCIFLESVVAGSMDVGLEAASQLQEESRCTSPAPATVRKCQSTHVYFLDHYIDLLSYLKSRQERLHAFKKDLAWQNQRWRDFRTQERKALRQRRTPTQAVQFQILTQVGQGGFGEVFLARKVDTDELCALKRMSKKHLHLQEEVQHILTERDVLTSTRSEWHVKLLYSFQDPDFVYLAMEFVQGGDIRTMLSARGVLREEDTRLYFAEMVMAIDALHQQGYIHRDLKPENFLIDSTGHIKLTDFGLSKGQLAEGRIEAMKQKLREVKDSMEPAAPLLRRGSDGSSLFMNEGIRRAYSIVGSADYMAPEILASKGYDYGVDYWSLGCILFEFLCGYSPFQAEDTRQTCVNVWHWQRVLQRPVYDTQENLEFNVTDEAWGLITSLITDRAERMTTLRQVKNHPWLAGLDWDNLRSMPASFVPAVSTPMDTSYFDDFSNPEDMVGYEDVLLRQAQLLRMQDPWKGAFVGFTFRHPDHHQTQSQNQNQNYEGGDRHQL